MGAAMRIERDDLSGLAIRALLEEHLRSMHDSSPPGSMHALDLDGLRRPGVSFWSAWSGTQLLGCGALKEIDTRHGEIKSMRTATAHLRTGVARGMLACIVDEARKRKYTRLSLETGAQAAFEPARKLYARFGFSYCPPFEGYVEDPHSVFMTKDL